MKKIQKGIALFVAMLLLATCLTGCGGNNSSAGYDETASFKLLLSKPASVSDELWEVTLQKLQSWSSVPIEVEELDAAGAADSISLQIASGNYPEVILSNFLNASDVSRYASQGVLVPLDDFINETDTPNIWKMFQENPETKAANYLPDGKMYSLPVLNEFEPNFLERVIFINKVWLDKLGLEIPKTTEELKEVLRAFKDGDPNGNGIADEIPMTFMQGHAYSCPEMMLSAWGYATKSGVYDSYTTVKGGDVFFAPMLDEWKEMVNYYRDLYAEGLLDMEAFTQTNETFVAKLQASTSKIGVFWSNTNPVANPEEYIAISPIGAEGYDIVWQKHPGIIGNRNVFSITTSCKNPKAVMKWIDHFYELENSLEFQYGVLGGAINKKNEQGVYTWNSAPDGKSLSTFIAENRPISSVPCYLPYEIFGKELELNDTMKGQAQNYELYKDYLTDEPWPRPYYSIEEANTLSELQTDIFSLVDSKLAKWVVGTDDVETDWDQYVQSLKKMGVDKLISVNQDAYDRFQNGIK